MSTQVPRTRWGGIADGRFRPSGFFRVDQGDGVFWLVDPDGGRFLSKGVNTVRFDQDQIQNSDRIPYAEACLKKYGSETTWRDAAARRLAVWGFNTLGSWSDEAVATAGSSPLAVTPQSRSRHVVRVGKERAGRERPQTGLSRRVRSGIRHPYSPTSARPLREAAAATRVSSDGSSTMNCAGALIGAGPMNC